MFSVRTLVLVDLCAVSMFVLNAAFARASFITSTWNIDKLDPLTSDVVDAWIMSQASWGLALLFVYSEVQDVRQLNRFCYVGLGTCIAALFYTSHFYSNSRWTPTYGTTNIVMLSMFTLAWLYKIINPDQPLPHKNKLTTSSVGTLPKRTS